MNQRKVCTVNPIKAMQQRGTETRHLDEVLWMGEERIIDGGL